LESLVVFFCFNFIHWAVFDSIQVVVVAGSPVTLLSMRTLVTGLVAVFSSSVASDS
jgi:hypothetical protein